MAKKGKMLVLTNCAAGKDAEFNKWYNEVHAKEVVGLRGFTSLTRYATEQQAVPPANPPKYKYVAVYDLDDVDTAKAQLAAERPNFTMSDAIDRSVMLSAGMEEIFSYTK